MAAIFLVVSVSTALVSPAAFLGLPVTAFAEKIGGSSKHKRADPNGHIGRPILLVGGQILLQHAWGGASAS